MPTRQQTSCKLRLERAASRPLCAPPTFPQFSIQNPSSATPQPIDPPLPGPFAPIREPPVAPHYACHDHYDLHAIEDARHSLGSPC
jgi:hypothetical protein